MVTVVQPFDSIFVKMHNGRGRSALHIDFSFGKSSGGVKTDSAESELTFESESEISSSFSCVSSGQATVTSRAAHVLQTQAPVVGNSLLALVHVIYLSCF